MKQAKIKVYTVTIKAITPVLSVIRGIAGVNEQGAIISALNSQDFIGIKSITVKLS